MGDKGTETLWESHKDTHPERDTHTLRVIHAHGERQKTSNTQRNKHTERDTHTGTQIHTHTLRDTVGDTQTH